MKYSLINRIAVPAIVVGAFLALAPHAHAEVFSLPPELTHEGLAFSPATFDRQLHLPTKYTKISFVSARKLAIKSEKHKEKTVEALVVTPSQATNSETNVPIPTPTIYIAPSKAELAKQIPTPTPKLYTPSPTIPLSTPTTIQTITTVVPANTGGLNPDKLFDMSNAYRQSKGLAPLEKEERSCSLASSRAPEINTEVAEGRMHSGLHARNLPYWNTENIISMNSEEAAFNWWINDTIHRQAIEGNYKYSCVACSGNACAQEFTNFQPK